MDLKENCTKYVAFLRALYLIHQNHHWLTGGVAFYGNHLLFERIYKSAADNADSAAEKFIGLFGSDALGAMKQPKFIQEVLEKYTDTDTSIDKLVDNSTAAEEAFLAFAEKFYTQIKESENMSLGLDDMIMNISNDRETSVYLLKQTYTKEKKMSKLNDVARKFQKKLAQIADAGTPDPTTDKASQVKQKINSDLTVNLANRNWGEVGFNGLYVTNKDNRLTINYNLIIPTNAPPFTDKRKYPQGLNQFKQEMMDFVSNSIRTLALGDMGVVQIITVNGQ